MAYLQFKTNIPDELIADILQIPSSSKQVTKPDLDDEKKRWLIVGICVHTIVAPALRSYIEPIINSLYRSMKQNHNIHSQNFPNHLKKYIPTHRDLNYEAINNNKNKKKKFSSYDYNVQNEVDFAKLFLVTHMAHFTGFDHTCDSSALLGLLINIDKFPSIVQKVADKIRSDIRNPWAHCDFSQWDANKYISSFQLMYQLIRNLGFTTTEENRILGDLTIWETNGILFLQGKTIGLDLLEEVTKQTTALAKYAITVTDETEESFKKVENELLIIQNRLISFTQQILQIESKQEAFQTAIEEAGNKIAVLGDKHTKFENRQTNNEEKIEIAKQVLEKTIEQIEELNISTSEIVSNVGYLSETQACTKKGLTEIKESIGGIKEDIEKMKYNSHVRQEGKVYFYPPDRIKFFVGRRRELKALQANFIKNKDSQYAQVVCGLGGCGKTTVAIEYAWQFQNFYPGGIFWMSAESNEILETSVSNLAIDVNTTANTARETLLRTLKWIATLHTQWLLIIDNADIDELSFYMKELFIGTWKRNTCGHILITSRREPKEVEESFQIDQDDCLYLDVLSPEEGLEFLKTRTGINSEHENEIILELSTELDGLPLALEQAGAYIKAKQCSFEQYMGKFTKQRQKLLNAMRIKTSQITQKERLAVKTTWQLNIDYIQKASEEEGIGASAVKIMEIASFLSPDDIPIEIINDGSPPIEDEEMNESLQDSFGGKQIIEILTRFSLFQQYREDTLSVHRLVQEVIRDSLRDLSNVKIILQHATRMINKALISTLSPYKALCVEKGEAPGRGSLYLWSKLATNANILKSHIVCFIKKRENDGSLHLNLEMANLLHTSAVFHSVYQRQDEALADQEQLLHIMTVIDIPKEKCLEFTSVKIPLLERDRNMIQDCLSAVLINFRDDGEFKLPDEIDSLRIKGNDAFKENRYHDAIQYYTEGIKSSPEKTIDFKLFSNRSLLYLKVNDYENALKDAEKCIVLAPNHWKGYCWKAYALANLVRNGELTFEFEKVGLASACIAANLNSKVLVEYNMKVNYPLVVYKIIENSSDLCSEISSIQGRPYSTILLKSGYYTLTDHVIISKSIQIIGIDNNVEIDLKNYLQIFNLPTSVFSIHFKSEWQIHIHFENLSFVPNSAQIGILSNATATFYKCKISNGARGCDDYPRCKGGSGCIKHPVKCSRLMEVPGLANFATGEQGYPGLWVGSGGKLIVRNCVLDKCGGGGVLSDGDGAHLEIRYCTIRNMRSTGVEARNGGMVKVEDNVIIDNQLHGIMIAPRGNGIIHRNNIQGNGQEGIFCGGILNPNNFGQIIGDMRSKEASQAVIADNIILQNGLSGISLDGGTYEVSGNRIVENWLWGMMIKSRSSVYVVGNDIFENKCGGIRIGSNYSASVIIDGNTIRDHTGPDIYVTNSPEKMIDQTAFKAMSKEIEMAEESSIYTRPPIITNRNIRRNNNKGVQHPKEAVQIIQTCCFCYRSSLRLRRCSKCGAATYCSKECQANHWKKHRHMCKLLHKEYTIQIKMKNTEPFMKPGMVRNFNPSLKGIKEGPKPDPKSSKKFIVKVQSGQEYGQFESLKILVLYDRSVTLDIKLSNPELYCLVNECGILAGESLSTKKIFCWASFKDNGSILCIHTDNLPPFQTW
ncbi:unnamed protein product [Mytilus edulis]|uniref:MYND-type domain-containing protein n=1 Tax=Mytilus edulis TaxID=6550 RepID=A0A8S3QLH5_MYTED|nr:unnamed protein product [Mytilus edulis]